MLDNAPQPDAYLRILPSHGGQSGDEARYCTGAPELAVEICLTSTEVDFGPKRKLYQRAGVREYITIETFKNASSGECSWTAFTCCRKPLRTVFCDLLFFQASGWMWRFLGRGRCDKMLGGAKRWPLIRGSSELCGTPWRG